MPVSLDSFTWMRVSRPTRTLYHTSKVPFPTSFQRLEWPRHTTSWPCIPYGAVATSARSMSCRGRCRNLLTRLIDTTLTRQCSSTAAMRPTTITSLDSFSSGAESKPWPAARARSWPYTALSRFVAKSGPPEIELRKRWRKRTLMSWLGSGRDEQDRWYWWNNYGLIASCGWCKERERGPPRLLCWGRIFTRWQPHGLIDALSAALINKNINIWSARFVGRDWCSRSSLVQRKEEEGLKSYPLLL